jgi:predicted ABC-type ATPase
MNLIKFTRVLIIATSFLYSEEYFYFSPEKISGYLESYNEKEKEEIAKDLQVVRSVCHVKEAGAREKPFYLATAGGPGSRKSTILERFIRDYPVYQTGVYLDPDQRALKFMAHTYYAQSLNALQAASSSNYLDISKAAYEKWRGASNYIAFTLLEEALQKRTDIIHGTTSTGNHVPEFFQKLRAEGYQITLVLSSCEDDVRKEAIEYRNSEQRFYQSTPEDALAKGKIFPEKIATYFDYADTLYLYWSDDLLVEERLGAIFDKGEIILGPGCACAYEVFMAKYEEDREALKAEGKSLLSWEEIVQKYLSRFKL